MTRSAACGSSGIGSGNRDAGDWRDPERYRALAGMDRAGLAWEWLRRDPAYVEWYASASELTRSGWDGGAARAWGLHFRGGSEYHCSQSKDYLVGRCGSGYY
ncbi:transcriptional regulator domain-containing protein [Novosphingobium sp.]|uniref:transcriptional regulator domain-containing protein n=1 Tax=Novosphingobium sp. TaxID=1874826 RepID=UPI003FA53FD8